MQMLGFLLPRDSAPCGFSLIELMVCLGLMASVATLALPSWQRLEERNRVEAARDQLIHDLQSARIRALQRGEALQLVRLSDCTWATSTNSDWSCGWTLRIKATQALLQTTSLTTPMLVTFAKTSPLDISQRGDLGTVGERWVIQSRQASFGIAIAVCLNSASRLRWQSGTSCS
jgi:type IV fimbrial biogenesis protein FimT